MMPRSFARRAVLSISERARRDCARLRRNLRGRGLNDTGYQGRACADGRSARGHQHVEFPAGDGEKCRRRSRRRLARHGARDREPPRRAGEVRAVQIAGRACGRGRKGRVGRGPHRRRAAARRADRLHRRLLRDRGDISGAGGLALEDDRRRRRQGRAHRGDGSQRLWALARPQHQAGRAACGTDTGPAAVERFQREKLEALAGFRPGLLEEVGKLPGTRILDGKFTSVQQAIGTAKKNTAAAAYLSAFVEEAKASGLVARLIAKHKVVGRLSVAPPA